MKLRIWIAYYLECHDTIPEYSSIIQRELTVTIPVGGYLHDERNTDVRKDFLMLWEPRIC